MQTFLPYPDFKESARVLDNQRLGKQRVETLQILKALTLPEYGWKNHPATKMWRGFERYLVWYGLAICLEWRARGYKDTCLEKISAFEHGQPLSKPKWIGDDAIHASHRSNLLRKDPQFYARYAWTEPHDLPYVWP